MRFIVVLAQISEHTQTYNYLPLLIAQIIKYFSFIRFISAGFAFQRNSRLCSVRVYVCVYLYAHNYSAAKISLKLHRNTQ